MNDKITFKHQKSSDETINEMLRDIQLLEDSDKIKIKALYNKALVANVRYVDNELVCANCGASRQHFKFLSHALYDTTEKEIYQCDQCEQYIFTHYLYKEKPEMTFK